MKLGIQLYSVRQALNEDFKGTLAQLAQMGFEGVEFAFNFGGIAPQELAAFLKDQGLQTIGIYEQVQNLCDPDAEVYRQAEALGCKYLTFGLSPKMLEEDFDACLETCRKVALTASSKGVTACYHAHAHEFAKINGECALDIMLREIPEMAFEPDTAWIKAGGEDVVGYMQKYVDRIPMIHAKDLDADGGITELGNGVIEFKPVIEFAVASNIAWISYEQDTTKLTAMESAQISLDYLRGIM
jgi:sugar phosphate isomerase/epimerase